MTLPFWSISRQKSAQFKLPAHYIPAFLCRFQLRDQFDRAITNNKKTALRLLFLEEISSPPNWFLTVGRVWCWWKFVFSGEEPIKFLTAKTKIYHNKKGWCWWVVVYQLVRSRPRFLPGLPTTAVAPQVFRSPTTSGPFSLSSFKISYFSENIHIW